MAATGHNPFVAHIRQIEGTTTRVVRRADTRDIAPAPRTIVQPQGSNVDYTAEPMATENQMSFIRSLATKHDYSADRFAARIDEIVAGTGRPVTRAGASKLIDTLKGYSLKTGSAMLAATTAPVTPVVPDGYYALEIVGDSDNDIAFYHVNTPTEGRWAGFTFVEMVLGGNQSQRLSREVQKSVLARIAADPAAASKLYGIKTETCGVCHRPLTNKASREAGIGPKCAANTGW